jgi:hypothetical protein
LEDVGGQGVQRLAKESHSEPWKRRGDGDENGDRDGSERGSAEGAREVRVKAMKWEDVDWTASKRKTNMCYDLKAAALVPGPCANVVKQLNSRL